MALSHRPAASIRPVRAVSRKAVVARTIATLLLAPLAYIGLAGAALGPGSAPLGNAGLPGKAPQPVAVAHASLTYSGVDPIITGSIDHLFESASFTGPNRAMKTDRVRPAVDAMAIAQSFEAARLQIAALRAPADPAALGQSSIADADNSAEPESGPRISVASLHPNAAAALDAIAGIAPKMDGETLADVALPVSVPEQLAYARATAPATVTELQGEPMAGLSDKELWCLATAVYFEARGEVYRGTICGVVFQNQNRRNACQFSFACDGIPETVTERKPWEQAEEIATKVTNGELYLTEVGDATHYHATYVRPAWAPRMSKVAQIGLHVFYKFKRGWLFG
jgi:hypothetical protein